MRANSKVREPELQVDCLKGTYVAQQNRNAEAPSVVLHDGPPYANGRIHMGHVLNKVLKDIIVRFNILQGHKVSFVPGWDCHGLPIEMKAIQEIATEVKRADASNLQTAARVREASALIATEAIQAQREAFMRLGVCADWENPYLTMAPAYEASQMDVFRKLFDRGCIFRGVRPVYWSPSSRTALAEAELEYPEGHKSLSAYVVLPLVGEGSGMSLAQFAQKVGIKLPTANVKHDVSVSVCIWTTTPWTLPSNQAVAFSNDLNYVLLHVTRKNKVDDSMSTSLLVVAEDLVASFVAVATDVVGHEIMFAFKGSQLAGLFCNHPLAPPGVTDNTAEPQALPMTVPLIPGDHVTSASGTGLVHIAPSHGHDDFLLGQKAGLKYDYCAVDDDGRFTSQVVRPDVFSGMEVLGTGNKKVMEVLQAEGRLWASSLYEHKYPYDWRSKKPVIVRTTAQWFCSLAELKDDALAAAMSEKLSIIPSSGRSRLSAFIGSRSEWCISRQRSWGVPIPAFYDVNTGAAFMNSETIAHVREIFAKKGSSSWWTESVEALLPESHRHLAATLRKGYDTLDVWFDSGSSWKYLHDAVLKQKPSHQTVIYCEGSDQHRGWFQSSLLTSIAVEKRAPYDVLVTHGFVLDEKGRKMSKSLGNVIDPMKMVDKYSADILRMWVASSDYTRDVLVGDEILGKVGENVRKIRNTCRFLLGNLKAFRPSHDFVTPMSAPTSSVSFLDAWLFGRIKETARIVEQAYRAYDFCGAQSALVQFAVNDLSSVYLDGVKDRLYCNSPSDTDRKMAQSLCYLSLLVLMKGAAPIMCHTSEEVWHSLLASIGVVQKSPLLLSGPLSDVDGLLHDAASVEGSTDIARVAVNVFRVREVVNRLCETLRKAKSIGPSTDAVLHVLDTDVPSTPQSQSSLFGNFDSSSGRLQEVFGTSSVQWDAPTKDLASALTETIELKCADDQIRNVVVVVAPSPLSKCPRCWIRVAEAEDCLCDRCKRVLEK